MENTSTTGICSPRRRWIDAGVVLLVPELQRDGDAALPRACGATGAVQVRLVVLGRVVVHDDVDRVDVDATRGDIGRDEHRHLAGDEVGERALARALTQVTVDRERAHTLTLAAA